jgi:hypothetical protein
MPKVMVYRDAIPDIDTIFKIIQNSESLNDESLLIEPWKQWDEDNGIFSKLSKESTYVGNKDGSTLEQQQYVRDTLNKLISDISEDYLSMWKNVGTWKDVESFEDLERSSLDLLKYNQTDNRKILAMDYHTDNKEYAADRRDHKQVITFTVYLNDDYEGGDISYINEEDQLLVTYKPKKGDVTIFPSGYPYFHGVKPVYGNNKYLARTFLLAWYPGSEEWLENEKKYGSEKWAKIDLENENKKWQSREYGRIPLLMDEEYPQFTPAGYTVFRYKEEMRFEF